MIKHYRILNTKHFHHELACHQFSDGWMGESYVLLRSILDREKVTCKNCLRTHVFIDAKAKEFLDG